MGRIEGFAKGAGLVLALVFVFFPEIPQTAQFLIFGSIMLVVGIPHGGIDHLTHTPEITSRGLVRFVLHYLLLMAGYGLLWWMLPMAALAAFLGMSAYHFGQSHFLDRGQLPKKEGVLYLLKGSFFLSVILFGDWEKTQEILRPILVLPLSETVRLGTMAALLLTSLLAQIWKNRSLQLGDALDYLVLAPVLYFSPLLISFGVYFGFWHSLPSMLAEYRYLSQVPAYNTPLKFGKQLLPFSGISMVGIGLILGLGFEYLESEELYLLFFVLISLISLPHILYMDTFLKEKFQN